ncbi:mitotic-spindle organizing protein 1 isoform X2 [Euwallacea fornicatus]|uniref:mitotic-spindle organizing protein 1 isoform X1 n=1 Tax=Euwallacea fornicatus TaxID=995702 RepID=UPI0033906991
MDSSRATYIKEAQSTLTTVQQISELLNTGLSPEALTICVRLCEDGINPEVLASLVADLQREIQEYQNEIHNKPSNISKNIQSSHNL